MSLMDVEFEGPVVEWRGPVPFYFVRVPEEESATSSTLPREIEYWGQVPVVVRINDFLFTTALFPKGGCYVIPLRAAVRKSAAIELYEVLWVTLSVGRP